VRCRLRYRARAWAAHSWPAPGLTTPAGGAPPQSAPWSPSSSASTWSPSSPSSTWTVRQALPVVPLSCSCISPAIPARGFSNPHRGSCQLLQSLSYRYHIISFYRYHIVIILLLYRYHMLLVVRTQQKTTQKFITTHTAEPSQRKAVIPPERLEQQEADGDVSASRSRTSTKQACAAMPHMQLTALLWTACTRFAGSTRKHSWFT